MAPKKTIKTKNCEKRKVHTVLSEYKSGKLHSGSKEGPVVKNRKQAIAIALNVAKKKCTPKKSKSSRK